MGLQKNIKITIKDFVSTLSSPLNFYKNDSLTITFEIEQFGIEIINGVRQRVIMPINPLSAILLIENPAGVDSVKSANVFQNRVTFKLTKEQTNFTGITKMQIVLKDNDGYRITLPEMQMEIREPIATEIEDPPPPPATKKAICGEFLCGQLLCGQGLMQTQEIEVKSALSEDFKKRFNLD